MRQFPPDDLERGYVQMRLQQERGGLFERTRMGSLYLQVTLRNV